MPLFQVDIPRESLLYTSIKRFANFPFFSSSPPCFFLLLHVSYLRFVSFPFSLSVALIRLYLILTRTFFSLCFLFVVSVYCVYSRSLLLVVLLSLFQLPVTFLPSHRSPSLQSSLVLFADISLLFFARFSARPVVRLADKIFRDIVFGIITIINARAPPSCTSAPRASGGTRSIPNLYRAFNRIDVIFAYPRAKPVDQNAAATSRFCRPRHL